MKLCLLLSILEVMCTADAWWFLPSGPAWDGLEVTYGINPFTSFQSIPRKSSDALKEGYTVSKHCNSANGFIGTRYWKNNDPAAMPLYDRNGYIIGIQSGVSVVKAKKRGYPSSSIMKWFHRENDIYTVTMYFVNPADLGCDSGRTDKDFGTYGTGKGLWLQVGNRDALHMPMLQSQVKTPWVKGGCVWGMGRHYWHNLSMNMNCTDFTPVFLMYNSGKLNAFGFAFTVDLPSPRFEHPPVSILQGFLPYVPKCFTHIKGRLSTMHVYMTSNGRLNFC